MIDDDDRIEAQLEGVVTEIRLHRVMRGLTQVDLANLAGVNRSTVADYETSRHLPNLVYLDKIARGLGYQIGIYLEESGGGVSDGNRPGSGGS